jgi:hypothetical protein
MFTPDKYIPFAGTVDPVGINAAAVTFEPVQVTAPAFQIAAVIVPVDGLTTNKADVTFAARFPVLALTRTG